MSWFWCVQKKKKREEMRRNERRIGGKNEWNGAKSRLRARGVKGKKEQTMGGLNEGENSWGKEACGGRSSH